MGWLNWLNDRFCVWSEMWIIASATFLPNLRAIISDPTLLFQPHKLHAVLFGNVWNFMAPLADEGGKEVKTVLLKDARGVVLDIGAGHGHSLKYLDPSLVTEYIAIEPITSFGEIIHAKALSAGFQSSQIRIIPLGIQDHDEIITSLGGVHKIDTIISILTLCGIPNPQPTIKGLVQDLLKPGGRLLFYEHVLCEDNPLGWWQWLWTPVWRFLVGCDLDRPSHRYVDQLEDVWETKELGGKPGEEPNLWWHRTGKYVKKLK